MADCPLQANNRNMIGVVNAILIALLAVADTDATKPRHIVMMVADDLGWNDIGFNNPSMITPNIDRLAAEGVILNNSYVQPVCTPSRHAFMTGIYPFKAGLSRGALLPRQPVCSPLNMEYLPQKLKTLGYSAHAIGKWHLGFCNWNCTPTYRGFDSFFGFYNGQEDYYNKTVLNGKDFRVQEVPILPTEYSSYLYAERAEHIIQTHDQATPMFLYAAFQSVHIPIQVPKKYEDLYPNIKTEGRRQYCGMVTALDDAVGRIVESLKNVGMLDDTLIIFTTDNGGWPNFYGNNWPLRGGKTTVFEGGTRGVAFIHGSGVQKKGYRYTGLLHAVDWHPTILAAAGGPQSVDGIDGINMWDAISQDLPSNRSEVVYNIDNAMLAMTGHAAIRVGDYKLIDGFPGPLPNWYPPDQVDKTIAIKAGDVHNFDENAIYEKMAKDSYRVNKLFGQGLYNLKDDPTEHHDISKQHPNIVKALKARLEEHRKHYVKPNFPLPSPDSNPDRYGGYWSPGWC